MATTLIDSDELTVNLCHFPSAANLTVEGSGDSDVDAVLGVWVGVGVRVGVAVRTTDVFVGVAVAVGVCVCVAVCVGVLVAVGGSVSVGSSVGVCVGALYTRLRVKLPVLLDLKVVASIV